MPFRSPKFLHGRILRNSGSGIFYRMEVSVPDRIEFVPGQFAMVSGWPGNDPLLPRPLAIFRAGGGRGKATVEFVYKVAGRGTALLSGLHEGDPLALTLPLGRGFEFPGEDRSWWLVGGGVGFSSVFPAAAALDAQRADFEIFLGARTRDQLPPGDWIPGASVPGRVHLCTDDGTSGFHGTAAAILRERLDRRKPAERARLAILACGPREMLKTIAQLALPLGAGVQVSLENHMACGFGVCWGCVTAVRDGERTGYRRVCREGPVFDAREVVW
ncbi:MAG: dihydroorotate dehydrogenase electron transfer subunit [Deltaproteobacteria bacterium]